jgi:outer membrane autotransporter protein
LAGALFGWNAPAYAMIGVGHGHGGGVGPGDVFASIQTVLLDASRHFRESLLERVHHVLQQGPNWWGEGFAGWNRTTGTTDASTLRDDNSGVFTGFEIPVSDSWRLGAAAGLTESKATLRQTASRAHVQTYDGALYADGSLAGFEISAGVAYASHDVHSHRIFSSTNYSAADRLDDTQAFLLADYPVDLGGVTLEPEGGFAWIDLGRGHFRETGSGYVARTPSEESAYSTLGARAEAKIDSGSALVTPYVSIAWQHLFGKALPVANLDLGGTLSNAPGVPLARDSAALGVGVDVELSADAALQLGYNGNFAAHQTDQTLGLTLSVAL